MLRSGMRRKYFGLFLLLASLGWVLLLVLAGCQETKDSDESAGSDDDPIFSSDYAFVDDDSDAWQDDDDQNPPEPDDDTGRQKLIDLFDEMGFAEYLDVTYTRVEEGRNGYTNYYYSLDDCRCFNGGEAHVAVSWGTENKVMLFMEGGGARWPGGGFAVNLDMPEDVGFKSRTPENPLRNWHFVYIPQCDNSIHSGDNIVDYGGHLRYHWGLRLTAAAVSLMTELFPDPEKVLVAGSSAGGFGTILGWAVAKSQYMDTDTYVLNDSGVGFWNPARLDTWETIKEAWNWPAADDCTKCQGTVQTYLYEKYLEYDPQVRIGMFTSYHDWLISDFFLGMDKDDFTVLLFLVTDEIRQGYSDRFNRFFIEGDTHTSYEFMLPGGPRYKIDGISFFDWIGQLVNDDSHWPDLLE